MFPVCGLPRRFSLGVSNVIEVYSRGIHNVHMFHADLGKILRSTNKGLRLLDERGRKMSFPTRQDYIRQMQKYGLVTCEADFVNDDYLTEAVYLDWLSRSQVGCIFAQLLARPAYRTEVKTVVARGSSGTGDPEELATQIANLVGESVSDDSTEALSVLLPQILDIETLTRLVWEFGKQPKWMIERETRWRNTLVLVGLRVEVEAGIVAETLGMGPFGYFPTTRQCPITTLEIRTKTKRAKKSRLSKTHLAAHLADISTDHILTPRQFRTLFRDLTPRLRKRILENQEDTRAKAGVTYSLPVVIWNSLKTRGS